MQNIEIKHALYKQVGVIGKALGHETRLEIVELLSQCPQTVEKIAEMLSTDIKSVSAHLKVLTNAGLVSCTRQGRFMRYELLDADIMRLAVLLGQTALRTVKPLADMVKDIPQTGETVSLAEALEKTKAGNAILIDVRPSEEFASGHLPNALSMPLDTLGKNILELPTDVELVAYCRGRFCLKAKEAAQTFAKYGRVLRIVPVGVMEWVAQGNVLTKE